MICINCGKDADDGEKNAFGLYLCRKCGNASRKLNNILKGGLTFEQYDPKIKTTTTEFIQIKPKE